MTFTLTLEFRGMCLYVPGGDEMHVLLPATPHVTPPAPAGAQPAHNATHQAASGAGHAGNSADAGDRHANHVEPHAARLVFDTAHLRRGRVRPDGIPAFISLRNILLELPALGSVFRDPLPDDLVRVERAVDPDVFGPSTAEDLLTARVTLRSGECTDHDPGGCWEWKQGPRRMCHVVEWSITDYPGDHLELPLKLLGGATGKQVPPLYPVNGTLRLEVWHVPPAELPPEDIDPTVPPHDQPAHHFTAYDRVLQAPVGRVPRFRRDACPEPGRGNDKGRVGYTCMSATL